MMDDHWLVRDSTIKRLWIVFAIVLAATVLMDLVIEHHPYFGLDGTFGLAPGSGSQAALHSSCSRKRSAPS